MNNGLMGSNAVLDPIDFNFMYQTKKKEEKKKTFF